MSSCKDNSSLQYYMWVFILARVLIGGGTAVYNTVAMTYLEENLDNRNFGMFLGSIDNTHI